MGIDQITLDIIQSRIDYQKYMMDNSEIGAQKLNISHSSIATLEELKKDLINTYKRI